MLARATENTESNLNATEGPESSEVGPSTKPDSMGSFDKNLIRKTALSTMSKNTNGTQQKATRRTFRGWDEC